MHKPAAPIRIFTEIAALVAIVGLGLLSLSGSITPPSVSTSFGSFTLTTNDAGVALYQKQRYASYQLSPYFDTIKTPLGTLPLLPQNRQDNVILSQTDLSIAKVTNQMLSYVDAYSPQYQARGAGVTTTYSTIQNGSVLIITKTIQGRPVSDATVSQTALSYSRDDILVDEYNNLYTDPPQTTLDFLEQNNGLKFNKPRSTEYHTQVTGRKLTIINPNTAGALTVVAAEGQTLYVDKQLKRVEISEPLSPTNNTAQTQLRIVYEDTLGDSL